MNKNPCLGCDCYDPDMGCTMPGMDKWYACPLESPTDLALAQEPVKAVVISQAAGTGDYAVT